MFSSPYEMSGKKDILRNSILNLYRNAVGCDITIQVKWKEKVEYFKAHRLLLSMRSPIFEDELKDKENFSFITFVIEGVPPRIINILLWYIYSDELKVETAEEILMFAKVANYYQISGIKRACRLILLRYIPNEQNVCILLDIATFFNLPSLQMKCMKFIENGWEGILNSPSFAKCSQNSFSVIINKLNTSISQRNLLEGVLCWLQSNKRADKIILSKFNLASIPEENFLELLKKYPCVLTAREAISILSNMIKPGVMDLPHWYKKELNADFVAETKSNTDFKTETKPNADSDAETKPNIDSDAETKSNNDSGTETKAEETFTSSVSISVAEVVDKCSRIETVCDRHFSKSCFFGRDAFEGTTTIMLRQCKKNICELGLTMLELPFGTSFVPEDILKLDIRSCVNSFEEKSITFSLQATVENYYVIFHEKMKIPNKYPLIISVHLEVKGLREWRPDIGGPSSDEQYRVMEVPESDLYHAHLISEGVTFAYLTSLSEWLMFIDPLSEEKIFVASALYFDSITN